MRFPSDTVNNVIGQLKDHGSVTRGWIGVQIQPVTQDIADSLGLKKAEGALVAEPQANSPAAKAGIEAGDVITAVDGVAVKDARDLAKRIGSKAPKSTVKLAVLHKGSEKTLDLTLGELPNTKEARANTEENDNGGADLGKLGLTLGAGVPRRRCGQRRVWWSRALIPRGLPQSAASRLVT